SCSLRPLWFRACLDSQKQRNFRGVTTFARFLRGRAAAWRDLCQSRSAYFAMRRRAEAQDPDRPRARAGNWTFSHPQPACRAKWHRKSCVLARSEEHTSELQSRENLVCRLLLEKKKRT